MMKSLKSLSVIAIAALMSTGTVSAAPVIYFGEDLNAGTTVGPNATAARNAFLGSLSGVGTEDFESFASGTSAPLNLSFPGSIGSIGATLTSTGGVETRTGTNAGRFATSGNSYLRVPSGDNFTITFDTAVSAFGFLGTDIGDFVPSNMVLTLTDSSNVSTQQIVNHTIGNADNNVLFWGFTDLGNTYTSISFSNPGGGDIFGFDDMTIGDQEQIVAVSEPGMLAVFGLALLAFGMVRRRRTV
jgi:hypothetical protein